MKKLLLGSLLLCISCASTDMMSISKVTTADTKDTLAINQLVNDTQGIQCTVWISTVRPQIQEVLNARTSGVLSVIAKKRAINMLYVKLTPQFETNCGPVLMDERRSFARLFSPLG